MGEGNVTIADDQASGEDSTERLNRDTDNTTKELYSIDRQQGNVDLTIDTRLLTEDGRNQIKEDIKRTELLIEAVGDAATKDSVQLGDLRQHIQDLQKELDVQEAMARKDGGIHAQAFNDPKATPEQKQEALNTYAETYADIFDIDIEAARIIAVDTINQQGQTVAGLHYNQDGSSVILINDNAQDNGLTYANTIGHEVTHAQILQGGTRDRNADNPSTDLNESYSLLRGDYAEELYGFSFSKNDLGNLNTSTSNQHMGNTDSEVIRSNHQQVVQDNPQQVDYLKVMSKDVVEALTIPKDERYYLESGSTLSKLAEAAGLDVQWNPLQGRNYLEPDQVDQLQSLVAQGVNRTGESPIVLPSHSALYYAAEGETPEIREQQIRQLLGGSGGTHIPEDVYQAALEKVQNAEVGTSVNLSSERSWAVALTTQNSETELSRRADWEDTFLLGMLDDMNRSLIVATDSKAPKDMSDDAAIDTIINIAPIPAIKGAQVVKHADELAALADDAVAAVIKGRGTGSNVALPNKYYSNLNLSESKTVLPSQVNQQLTKQGYRAPYAKNAPVVEATLAKDTGFVRVFTQGKTQPSGKWIMKTEDIKGLTPKQIQQKYALPNLPTHIVNAQIPKGTKLRAGKVGANYGSQGGNVQYELLQRVPDAFSNARPL